MKKIFIYLIGIIIIGVSLTGFWIYGKYFQSDSAGFLSFRVERGEIEEVIRARGEVASQKDFDLEFSFSETVDKIFVSEGDIVGQGDFLMSLDSADMKFEQKSLEATLAKSRTSLVKLIAGLTDEDLAILEAKTKSAQESFGDATISLQNIQGKADSDLSALYSDVENILNDAYAKADDAINKQVDEMFTDDNTSNPQLSFSISDLQIESDVEWKRISAGNNLKELKLLIEGLPDGQAGLDDAILKAENNLSAISSFLIRLGDAVNSTSNVSQTTITTYKGYLNTARTNINTATSNISAQELSIASQKITNQNNIDTAKAQLNSAKNSLDVALAELASKKAPPRSEDVEIAESQIKEIENKIESLKEKIRKATIYAPAAAKVAKIYLEKGELSGPGRPAISLSVFNYKIQSDISELDIGKIKENNGNPVSITLDAFSGEIFEGKVISVDPKEIVKDGDKYYRINFYIDQRDVNIRPGMSADIEIKISSKSDVLKIPELSVHRKDGGRFVAVLEGKIQKEVEIKTGISDGENIEIISGLDEGQTVIVLTE